MRREKQRAETLTLESMGEDLKEENVDGKNRFFACYLLCSLCPRFKGHTYIGFTINPQRRIRQHNGEIRCGAWRTKHKRPWEMILCIHGFPSQVSALQFEWAWQHPRESLAVRNAAASFRSLSGVENKIKLAYTMLTLPQWERLNLTINFFSTKYMRYSVHCVKLPKHMRVSVHAMHELSCYMESNHSDDDDDNNDGHEDVDDLYTDMSAAMGTSLNHSLESMCPRDIELYDSPFGESESSDFGPQREQQMISHELTKPSKPMDEGHTTTPIRFQSAGLARVGDLFVNRQEDDLMQLVDPLEALYPTASPAHSTKERPTMSQNILFHCTKEPFDRVSSNSQANLKHLATPRTVNCSVSWDNTPVSPGCVVIDLLTPPSCIARSAKRHSSVRVEIIDLIDSPM